jgi:hypothetical protein
MEWGSTTINCYRGTYRPPFCKVNINEINILPNPATPDTPATVLQSGGRNRKRVQWEGFTTSLDDYNDLQADYIAGTQRTFTGPEGETLTAIIEDLSEPEYIGGFVNYSITLVEA